MEEVKVELGSALGEGRVMRGGLRDNGRKRGGPRHIVRREKKRRSGIGPGVLNLLYQCVITTRLHTPNDITYETQKSDTTRSGIAQNPSLRTRTPLFNTPPRREFLIYHPTTTTMRRVKARASKNEEREEKIRQALEERAQFNPSFEDLHHKYGIPKSTLCDRAGDVESRQKSHKDY